MFFTNHLKGNTPRSEENLFFGFLAKTIPKFGILKNLCGENRTKSPTQLSAASGLITCAQSSTNKMLFSEQ